MSPGARVGVALPVSEALAEVEGELLLELPQAVVTQPGAQSYGYEGCHEPRAHAVSFPAVSVLFCRIQDRNWELTPH
jgi:hypothetical protein